MRKPKAKALDPIRRIRRECDGYIYEYTLSKEKSEAKASTRAPLYTVTARLGTPTGEETEAGFAGEADGEQERILRKSAGKIMELLSVCRRKAEKLLEKESGMEKLLLKVERKISRVPKAGGFLKYIPEMILLIRSYIRNEYRDIPKWQIIELTASLIYFLMPLDAIPDAIPVLGWIDDAFTVLFTIRWFRETIDKYMTWREVFGRNHPEDRKLLEGLAAAAGEEKDPEKG